MKTSAVIAEFRRRALDTVVPYLWSDDEALLYANEAHKAWVRMIRGLRDSTSELTYLDLASGDEYVELDTRIIDVISARLDGDVPREIDVVGPRHELARARRTPGRLVALVKGEDEVALRAVSIPTEAYSVRLSVDRMPLKDLTFNSSLEIREEHGMKLVEGMLAMAYGKQDPETMDNVKAAKYQTDFEREGARAYVEKRRRLAKAGTVEYGGY